jgi:hypothetical protein
VICRLLSSLSLPAKTHREGLLTAAGANLPQAGSIWIRSGYKTK